LANDRYQLLFDAANQQRYFATRRDLLRGALRLSLFLQGSKRVAVYERQAPAPGRVGVRFALAAELDLADAPTLRRLEAELAELTAAGRDD